jgi:hypothetical protein
VVIVGLIGRTEQTAFPAGWFSTRAWLAVAVAAGECEPRVADEFFTLTSVLKFRRLYEADRARHRDRVQRSSRPHSRLIHARQCGRPRPTRPRARRWQMRSR